MCQRLEDSDELAEQLAVDVRRLQRMLAYQQAHHQGDAHPGRAVNSGLPAAEPPPATIALDGEPLPCSDPACSTLRGHAAAQVQQLGSPCAALSHDREQASNRLVALTSRVDDLWALRAREVQAEAVCARLERDVSRLGRDAADSARAAAQQGGALQQSTAAQQDQLTQQQVIMSGAGWGVGDQHTITAIACSLPGPPFGGCPVAVHTNHHRRGWRCWRARRSSCMRTWQSWRHDSWRPLSWRRAAQPG